MMGGCWFLTGLPSMDQNNRDSCYKDGTLIREFHQKKKKEGNQFVDDANRDGVRNVVFPVLATKMSLRLVVSLD